MFPGAHAQIYYNEAGEPLGWDYPGEPEYDPDDFLPDDGDDDMDDDEPDQREADERGELHETRFAATSMSPFTCGCPATYHVPGCQWRDDDEPSTR